MKYKVYSNDELYHFGIKGMKWGIRRYQNEDGTLTEAGKKRYNKFSKEIDKQYLKGTKRQRKIVANEKGKYSDYQVKKAQAWIDAKTKLKDIQMDEIKSGGEYLERIMSRNALAGQLVGGIPLNLLFTMSTAFEYKDEFGKRMAIDQDYKNEMKSLKAEQKALKKLHTKEESVFDFYKDRNYGKGVDELTEKRGLYKDGGKLSSEQKSEYQSLAKNEGRYSIDFLEAVQNSEMLYKNDTKKMLKEYDKFLDNPDKYWYEDARKLKQV